MNSQIAKTFAFPESFSENGTWVLQRLSVIQMELFAILGIFQEVGLKRKIREFEEGTGWLQFPCKEETLECFTDSAKCTLVKTSMFNGHIGDTEENVVMRFDSKDGIIDLYINLYASQILLRYKAERISSENSGRVERLLQKAFDLSELFDEKIVDEEMDISESNPSNPDSHYNYK